MIPARIYSLSLLVLFAVLFLAACGRGQAPTPTGTSSPSPVTAAPGDSEQGAPTSAVEAYPLPTQPARTAVPYPLPTEGDRPAAPYPGPDAATLPPSQPSPTVTETAAPQDTATPTTSPDPYPAPVAEASPTAAASPTAGDAYPGPGVQPTPYNPAYPPPATQPGPLPTLPPSTQAATLTSTPTSAATPTTGPSPTQTPTSDGTPTRTVWPSATLRSSPPATLAPPVTTGTVTVTPTPRIPGTAQPPPGAPTTITVWHAWSGAEAQTLQSVLAIFKTQYPNVTVNAVAYPRDELRNLYMNAAYAGKGPDLVLGPAEWGPALYDMGLLTDLGEIATQDFLARINPAALAQTRYQNALIGLPHTIRSGVVLYRNQSIIPSAPPTYDELVRLARAATKNGVVGAYLDRGYYYSAAHLYGMGGQILDASGRPAFNNTTGAAWVNLLNSFTTAGPAASNTTRDVDLFKAGKVGMIIDGTWNQAALLEAVGVQNLVIDPWPRLPTGHMSGFIQTDAMYLNANSAGDPRYAALQLMGFFLAPEVQEVLTQGGHIPVLTGLRVKDPLMQQAMTAFEKGTAYPLHRYAPLYTLPLENALQSVFTRAVEPQAALQNAYQAVLAVIRDLP